MRSVLTLLILLATATATALGLARAETAASVIDGDTLRLDGATVRLHGVGAPALEQLCFAGAEPWACGEAAAQALSERVGAAAVHCERVTSAPSDPPGVICETDTVLNAWMVAQGWAIASETSSSPYRGEQEAAMRAGRGIWRGGFEPPPAWRSWAEGRVDRPDFAGCDVCAARKQRLKNAPP